MRSLRKLVREVIERSSEEPQIWFLRRAKERVREPGGKLGIFASAFDPLTKAHLEIIERARARVDEILLLADKRNADKEKSFASLEERLLMLLKFFDGWAKISLGLSSHPLFLEKLRALKKVYSPGTSFCFLVGYDTIVRVLDRRYYQDREAALDELFAEGEFLVAPRGSWGKEALLRFLEQGENQKFKEKVGFLEISDFASSISSTQVRERLRKGEHIQELVPRRILELIGELNLYGG